jgi:hypothetical protein
LFFFLLNRTINSPVLIGIAILMIVDQYSLML